MFCIRIEIKLKILNFKILKIENNFFKLLVILIEKKVLIMIKKTLLKNFNKNCTIKNNKINSFKILFKILIKKKNKSIKNFKFYQANTKNNNN